VNLKRVISGFSGHIHVDFSSSLPFFISLLNLETSYYPFSNSNSTVIFLNGRVGLKNGGKLGAEMLNKKVWTSVKFTMGVYYVKDLVNGLSKGKI